MNKYYSTYQSGFSEVIETVLKKEISDVVIYKNLDGLIVYSTNSALAKIKSIDYFNNSFQHLFEIKAPKLSPIETMMRLIISDAKTLETLKFKPSEYNRTFRVIISHENDLINIDNTLLREVERKISQKTNLKVNRSKPDHQFWILYRSEGYVFFSLRLTKILKEDKERQKGELRPQLAKLLCLLSEPKENELFLDPFAGSGSISVARTSLSKKGLILTSDIDPEIVESLKQKVKATGLNNRIVVKHVDFIKSNSYQSASIQKIVTDPPWGLFEKIDNLINFYSHLLQEIDRILVPNGIAVILIGNNDMFSQSMAKNLYNLRNTDKINVLVSGKKAVIYKFIKLINENHAN